MSELLKFMGDHPWLTFFLALLLAEFINRIFRHWNIRKHGYPPAHCDADGDLKEEKDEP
jgi:hypothetical protein